MRQEELVLWFGLWRVQVGEEEECLVCKLFLMPHIHTVYVQQELVLHGLGCGELKWERRQIRICIYSVLW